MNDHTWLKLLELVRRELSAPDAYVQIGGEEPSDPRLVWVPLSNERRLVAVLERAPEAADEARERLNALHEAFLVTTSQRATGGETPPAAASRSELDQALAHTASRARAESAIVFDVDSPVVWGCSAVDGGDMDMTQLGETAAVDAATVRAGLKWEALLDGDLDTARRVLRDSLPPELDGSATRVVERLHRLGVEHGPHAVQRRLRIAGALRELRDRTPRGGDPPGELTVRETKLNCVVREFATIYRLLLVFDGAFSPLHAEAAVQRALGHIETLVLALPPVDPGGGSKQAARVLRLV